MGSNLSFVCWERWGRAERRLVMDNVGKIEQTAALLMDLAYANDKTRTLAWELRFNSIVPPKRNHHLPKASAAAMGV